MGPRGGPPANRSLERTKSGSSKALHLTFTELEEQLGRTKSVTDMSLEEFLDSLGEIDLKMVTDDFPTDVGGNTDPEKRALARTKSLEKYGSMTVADIFRQVATTKPSGPRATAEAAPAAPPPDMTVGSYLARTAIEYVPPAPAPVPTAEAASPRPAGRPGGGAGAAGREPAPAAPTRPPAAPAGEAAGPGPAGPATAEERRKAKAAERARKNRESAAKSRLAKQQYTESLENQVTDLQAQNAQLRKQLAEARLAGGSPRVDPPGRGGQGLARSLSTPVEALRTGSGDRAGKRPREDADGARRSQRRKTVTPAP